METATKHRCKHGCGYEHAKRGPMNLHELYHCPKVKEASQRPQETRKASETSKRSVKVVKKPQKPPESACDCEEGPSSAFLSKSNPAHVGAIAAGYKKYCTECGEVFS